MPTVQDDVQKAAEYISDALGGLEEPAVMAFTAKQLIEASRGHRWPRVNDEIKDWFSRMRRPLADGCRSTFAIEVVPVNKMLFDKLRGKQIVPADAQFDETFLRSCLPVASSPSWGVVCIPATIKNHPAIIAYDTQLVRRASGFMNAASQRIESQKDAGLISDDAVTSEERSIPSVSRPLMLTDE